MLKYSGVVFAVVCLQALLLPSLSKAEQWQTVPGREKFLTVAVDLDSLQVGQHEDMVFFKLRADDHDDTIATRYVQASCSEFSLEVDRETVFHNASQSSESMDWKNNHALKSSPAFAQARLSFWGVTQAYGQAISLACRRVGNRAPERLQILQAESCAPSNPLRQVACASHATWQSEEIYAKAKYLGCLKRETAKLRAANTPHETLSQQAEQLCDAPFKEWHDAISKQSAMSDIANR